MPRVVKEFFTCQICGHEYDTEAKADECYLSHDIIYIGLERSEWKSLVRSIVEASYQGIYFDDRIIEKLLSHKIGVSR